ncbi:hypothetical protein WR25_03140 [Diploscapter pachys]|uniref:Uncharacterized protein n=1 Tax=Diploscapter pachys TaxID=2018661 RepID=A0A2A2KMT4_9BILA|nr:hypothetical protein WR25_03140 [Diploscapter pachys]
MMASFFNESDLEKCLKTCDFCRIPEKVNQQANALKTAKERRRGIFWIRERVGENGKEEAIRLKTVVQDEFKRRRKARELANEGVARKVRPRGDVIVLDKDSKRVESLTIVRREAIVRTVIQALDDNSSQTDNQLTSNTTPAICSPRRSAPTTTRLHSRMLFLFNSGMCPVQCENYYFADQH